MDKMRFYYVYVLISEKDSQFYIGSTSKLKERLKRHQNGYVGATKSRLPLNLVFYEAYKNKYDALRREKYLKTTKGKRTLRNMIKDYLTSDIN